MTFGSPLSELSATMLAHFIIARPASGAAPTSDWKKWPGAIDIVSFGSWNVRCAAVARKMRTTASRRSSCEGATASTSMAVR